MRTGPLALLAPLCSELASDEASCQLSADCPIAWTVGVPEPAPPADCSADCSVPLRLPAADLAVELLDWSTEPPSPGEWMRTGSLAFLAPYCCEVASDFADCELSAFWPICCTGSVLEPPADCPAAWSVAFLLPAADSAVDELDWVTSPSSPGL